MRTILAAVRVLFAVFTLGAVSSASAHYNMLLPQNASAKKGESITLTYQWGHPFEHQLYDAPPPLELLVLTPDGQRTKLTTYLDKATVAGGDNKQVGAYQLSFTPPQRGDFVFVLQSAPIWMEEDREFLRDTVKTILHVQAQRGWDARVGQGFEMTPVTRPYGLLAGMAFQAQALVDGKPLAGAMVEIERYNTTPPKTLPPDEHITRTAKTTADGVVTCTLTEPGWWCITAGRNGGVLKREGKEYPVRERATLWVYVDGK